MPQCCLGHWDGEDALEWGCSCPSGLVTWKPRPRISLGSKGWVRYCCWPITLDSTPEKPHNCSDAVPGPERTSDHRTLTITIAINSFLNYWPIVKRALKKTQHKTDFLPKQSVSRKRKGMAFSDCPSMPFVMFITPKMILHTRRGSWSRL